VPKKPFITLTPKKNKNPGGISEKVINIIETYTMIARKKYPSVKSLAEHFNVSERTVHRYLEIIKMIDVVDYDREKKGYFFPYGDRTKKTPLTENELIILLTAGEAISHLGKPFREEFGRILDKLTYADKKKSTSPIIFKIPDACDSERMSHYITTITSSIEDKRSIDITYLSRGKKEPVKRTVDPYGLIFHNGLWMLIGFCHLRKHIRTFALDRIKDLHERSLYFTPREGFDLKSYLTKSWGIMDGEEITVKLRVKPQIADLILRKKWHPSEVKTSMPDGSLELTYTVLGKIEIKQWIYSWLPHMEVMEPESLREEIRKELKESLDCYE